MDVGELRRSIEAHAERYLRRVFTERELADSGGDPLQLALRLAAKEATVKVLEPGHDDPVVLREVEVRRSGPGFAIALLGRTAAMAQHAGVSQLELAVSHARGRATALVVAGAGASCR